jgi:hypothetical protein
VFQQKRMFKVITPIERRDGGKYWMRLGNAYVNKDNSINVYLDAVPCAPAKEGQGLTLQLRELTDDELRERADKKASYAARGTLDYAGVPAAPASAAADAVPF